MNHVAFQPAPPLPVTTPQVGVGWKPSAPMQPLHRPAALARPPLAARLGQTPISVAESADLLFSMIAGVSAMTVGIAAMTVGIGGEKSAIPGVSKSPSKTWKVIGGVTATLGAIVILLNMGQLSVASRGGSAVVTR